jgi:hypothetical protein
MVLVRTLIGTNVWQGLAFVAATTAYLLPLKPANFVFGRPLHAISASKLLPLSAATVATFEEQFRGTLDHNADDTVSVGEAAAGVRASHELRMEVKGATSARRIDPFLCAPSIEPISFIDCVAARARSQLASGTLQPNDTVAFGEELMAFAGGLDDVPPLHWQNESSASCDQMVSSHDGRAHSCTELLRSGQCRLSCGYHELSYFQKIAPRRRVQASAQRADHVANGHAHLLVSSDWHLEPWYDTKGNGTMDKDTRVSRFNPGEATLANYGQCRAGSTPRSALLPACPTTGRHDPPISFGESHFAAFARLFPNVSARGVFFFIGDAQAHGAKTISIPSCCYIRSHSSVIHVDVLQSSMNHISTAPT